MARFERLGSTRRWRLLLSWIAGALVVAIYFALPDGETTEALDTTQPSVAEVGVDQRLDVVSVSPSDAVAGSAVTVHFEGAPEGVSVRTFAGKEELPVLSRRRGAVVVRLPKDLPIGRIKIRVAANDERSKPYPLQIKTANYRKPFRNLAGGFALLIFGIGILARGARGAVGLGNAHLIARLARRGPAALGLGAVLGALAQSTTAAAGLLAGLVASSLLTVVPAAAAFLGAQIGAATAPLVTGLIDPREGLLVVALGVLWLGFASDRRSSAIGQFVLGAGLIAFGLQTLRPGFEPFVQEPRLLSFVASLRADSVLHVGVCALLGAGLVAILQGPAPVVVLVLVLAQTTGEWDLRTALAVLSGSGLGAAAGALLTTPAGRACRRLAELHLLLGASSTLLSAATVGLWSYLADRIVPGVPQEIEWGKRVLLPNFGLHLGVAFALSQVGAAVLLLPLVRVYARALDRFSSAGARWEVSRIGDPVGVVRTGLLRVLSIHRAGLDPLLELALDGRREAGRTAEHRLADAHAVLEELVAGPVLALSKDGEGSLLGRAAFGCLQLEHALDSAHRQAERLIDRRVALSSDSEVRDLPSEDQDTLRRLHELLAEGIDALAKALDERQPVDLEPARAREIRMNGLEARARAAVLSGEREASVVRTHLAVLSLVDAYENAGNQVYRLSEALAATYAKSSAAAAM
jgi:Na+/phosphate symporter